MTDKDPGLGIYELTEPSTLTYRSLIEPRKFKRGGKEQGDPKFDGTFLFDPKSVDLAGLKAAAISVAKAQWPGRSLKELAFPFKNGDERIAKSKAKLTEGKELKPIQLAEAGQVVLTARSKFRPGLGGIENGKAVDYESDDAVKKAASKFYSGVKVYATFKFVAYNAVRDGDKDGVNCYLNEVFTLAPKGEKIPGTGSNSAAERFSKYVGSTTNFDPTTGDDGGDDDDIPM